MDLRSAVLPFLLIPLAAPLTRSPLSSDASTGSVFLAVLFLVLRVSSSVTARDAELVCLVSIALVGLFLFLGASSEKPTGVKRVI